MNILPLRNPFEICVIVIMYIPIYMIDNCAIKVSITKILCNKAMDLKISNHSIF